MDWEQIFFWFLVIFILILILLLICWCISKFKTKGNFNIGENFKMLETLSGENKITCPILYINMDKDTNRREFMESRFKKFGIKNYKRITGVNGRNAKDISKGKIDNISYINEFTNMTFSELGCMLSHLKSIKYAYDKGYDKVLIFEDDTDVALMNWWKGNLDYYINQAPGDWEILQLFHSEGTYVKNQVPTYHIHKENEYVTAAYLVNRKGMEAILGNVGHNIFHLKIMDSRMGVSDCYLYTVAKTYTLDMPIFIPNNSYLKSTIQGGANPDELVQHMANKVIEHYISK